jgi:hypothetical protein
MGRPDRGVDFGWVSIVESYRQTPVSSRRRLAQRKIRYHGKMWPSSGALKAIEVASGKSGDHHQAIFSDKREELQRGALRMLLAPSRSRSARISSAESGRTGVR